MDGSIEVRGATFLERERKREKEKIRWTFKKENK